jgi:hypothetical protein
VQQGKFGKGLNRRMLSSRSGGVVALRRLLFVLFVLALAAYPASRFGLFEWPRNLDPLAIPDLAEKPGFLTGWQMKLVDLESQNCVAALRRVGHNPIFVSTKGEGTACEVSDAIAVTAFSTARIRSEDMRCAIAARLYAWERHVLQPAARKHLDTEVKEILHFGSYNCRPMRGSNRMSQHATANAFDISGFKLADGRQISLLKDWNGAVDRQRFLREVRDGLCDWFNVTLSPDYNKDHADHFHVDMGLWRSCR